MVGWVLSSLLLLISDAVLWLKEDEMSAKLRPLALPPSLTLSLSRRSERVLSPVDKLPSFGREQQRRP